MSLRSHPVEVPALKFLMNCFGVNGEYSKLVEKRMFVLRSATNDGKPKDKVRNTLFFCCNSWTDKKSQESSLNCLLNEMRVHTVRSEISGCSSQSDYPSPIEKLTFLILNIAYSKNVREIRIKATKNELSVLHVTGTEETISMNLQPEAHSALFRQLKLFTWGLPAGNSDPHSGTGNVMLILNGEKILVGISFSIKSAEYGEIGTVRFINKNEINKNNDILPK